MTYDESLADRIRSAVASAAGPGGFRETKRFGGLCRTMVTHMAVGTGADDLMVKVGKDRADQAPKDGARPATMGQRTKGGVVPVEAADVPDADTFVAWVGPSGSAGTGEATEGPKKKSVSRG